MGDSILLFTLQFSVGVNTVHFDDRRALGQVGRHNYLADYINNGFKGRSAYVPEPSSAP